MCNEKILSRHYFPVAADANGPDRRGMPPIPGSSLEDIEKYAIQRTLETVGGNRTRAAEILKVSLRKIQYKLKEF
jgi:transcriptional regulator with PAS, ATPase and Fis domain